MAPQSSQAFPPSQYTQIRMEETQYLPSNESSSYNGLINKKKPVKVLDSPRESSRFSIDLEVDRSKASMQCTNRSSQEFNFDLPRSGPLDMPLADWLFHNGSLIPLNILLQQQSNETENNARFQRPVLTHSRSVGASTMHTTLYHHVYQDHPISSNYPPTGSPMNRSLASKSCKVLRASKRKVPSSEGSEKSSKKIMSKCFKSLVHFCKKVKGLRLEIRRVSPRMNDDSTRSGCSSPLHDSARETAISEAILYCKSSSRKHTESS